jgi:hypothetical protein
MSTMSNYVDYVDYKRNVDYKGDYVDYKVDCMSKYVELCRL